MSSNYNAHLTLEERNIIMVGIDHGSTKTAIANTIGKNNSTIGKEIKTHRILKHKCPYPLECSARPCHYKRACSPQCPGYVPFFCKRRDRSPGACNGCSKFPVCKADKYVYDSVKAHAQYRETLSDSRAGVDLSTSEAKKIGDTIKPLLQNGQSPYHIIKAHPELGICEKTLYNYIEDDVLHDVSGVTVMDLRRQVSRKLPKKKAVSYKKREDRKYLLGRSFKDYQVFMEENPDAFVTEMDTVYNDPSNGPFIQTFKFVPLSLMIAFLHPVKAADSMAQGVDLLEKTLGKELFSKFVQVLLTDRGSEFSAAAAMETSADNTRRCRVFYCDPMQSSQKGSLENNHIILRYICPK